MIIIKNGSVFNIERGFNKCSLLIDNGKIAGIGTGIESGNAEVIDADDCYVLPGFIDIHTHGAFGFDCMNVSCEQIDKLSMFFASKGVTGFLPTTITSPIVKTVKALENINKAIEAGTPGARILGIHLEGPFINNKFKGAHPEEYVMHPTIELMEGFIRKSNDTVRMVTLAPEHEGVKELIDHFRNRNIIFSAGHSALNCAGARKAFDMGIVHVTHLFNAMVGIHHREPGLAGAALDDDRVSVEIISDGVHIDPSIIRLVLKCKPPGKVAIVTDSTMAAGLDDGEYFLGEQQVTVNNGEARLSSGVLSGSTLTAIDAVRNMVRDAGVSFEQAVRMISDTPSRILNMHDKKGTLSEGKDADIVLVDQELNVRMTLVEGRVVFRS